MGAGDLRGDVETEAEALLLGRTAPRVNGWNSRASVSGGIGSPALATDSSNRRIGRGPDETGACRAVGQRVAEQVGEQLGDPRRVAGDRRSGRCRLRSRDPDGRPQLGDDLLAAPARAARRCGQRDAAAQPAAGEIQHVVDQARHAHRRCSASCRRCPALSRRAASSPATSRPRRSRPADCADRGRARR